MSANPNAALVKALDLVVHGPSGTAYPQVHILHYQDEATFESLWLTGLEKELIAIRGTQLNWKNGDQQILIIGNDPPNGVLDKLPSVNVHKHFTATSWLAAWKVKFAEKRESVEGRKQRQAEGKPFPEARIAVIDPSKSDSTGTIQAILAARDAKGESLVPRTAVLNAPSLDLICQWLNDSKTDDRDNTERLCNLLKSTIWSELTSRRDMNHALSNVLGAFLLRAEVGGKNPDTAAKRIQEYVEALLQTCGVASKPLGPGNGGWIERELRSLFDGAVLIDDMADLWGGFLGSAFGRGNPDSIRKAASGEFMSIIEGAKRTSDDDSLVGLPQRLHDFLASGRSRLSSVDLVPQTTPSQLGQEAPAPWGNFLLFLDLRLGVGERFLKQLARVTSTLLFQKPRNLPWLTDAGRKEFEADLKCGKTDETLLPRLISLLDPTLPIVIFSSSHRSELIDPFRDYGNIITTFRKPILSGLTGDWAATVRELRADFTSAIEQAGRIIRVRRAFSWLPSDRRSDATFVAPKALEVFIDESYYRKTNVYSIGCVVLLSESHANIRNFCKAIEDAGIQWGLSVNNRNRHLKEKRRLVWNGKRLECAKGWVVNQQSLPDPDKFLKKFASDGEQRAAWKKINRLAEDSGVRIFSAALGTPVTDQIGRELGIPTLQGVARDQADELHRELAKSLLLLLFTAHPEVSAALRFQNASIAIDVGTRTAVPEAYESRHEETYQRFGIAYTDIGLNSPTLRERCDMWNMAIDWARRQEWWNRGQIEARIVGERITPDERDLAQWTDTVLWDPRRKMISVSSYDGLNYLRETFARLSPAFLPHIVRARGCALFDFEDTGDWLVKLYCFPCFPYQPHYLADWIARCGVQVTGTAGEGIALQDAFSSGFLAEWNASKKDLLNAVVSMDGGDPLEGFRTLVRWLEQHGKPDGGCRATDLLLVKSHEASLKVDGNVLRSLFAKLG